MERPGRWSFVAIILYLAFQNKALCQCQKKCNMINENREFTKLPGLPSSTDLYNSILTTAACNGVLPDLIPKLQGQPIVENLSKCPYPQEILTKPLSVVPMTTGTGQQEPIIFSSQPLRQPASNQNVLFATPCGSSCASNTIPSIPQPISSPPIPSSNCISQIAQALPLENYSVCSLNAGVVQPKPIILQPQNQCNEVNAYFYNQIAEPISVPDLCMNLLNLPTLPPIQALPPINEYSGLLEITSNLGLPCLTQPAVFTNDCQQTPLQINVPLTSLPLPKVSVVSVSPSNCPVSLPVPCCPDYSPNLPPFQYPPQPPIVLESSKSSLKKLLPILLVALLNDRRCNDRSGCSCCCCPWNGGGSNIPIPYPIPIPINLVINTGSSSRNRENKDDDDEEDRKRK